MVNTILPPAQITGTAGETTKGRGLTVTVTEAVLEQPFISVPATVYGVVTIGDAVTALPVQGFRFVHGSHEYVEAPDAPSTVESPEQIDVGAVVVIVGRGLTVMVVESVAVLPIESVTVK